MEQEHSHNKLIIIRGEGGKTDAMEQEQTTGPIPNEYLSEITRSLLVTA